MHKGRVVLAGGSGFLGTRLSRQLVAGGYEVVILTRSPRPSTENIIQVAWDGKTLGDWAIFMRGAEAVVNLTGKSVNCRYTAQNRQEIIRSRVNSVNARVIGTEGQLLLTGRRCVPRRLAEMGFSFQFAHLEPALSDLLEGNPQ